MIDNKLNIKHLYWRAGFGPSLGTDYSKSYEYHLKILFDGIKPHQPVVLEYWNQVKIDYLKDLSKEAKAQYRKNERRARYDIADAILNRYAENNNILREKMTLFWMGHFACRVGNPALMSQYYNAIAENSLGKFEHLLEAMTKNAALLQYLNNNQNKKAHPNENFARELMELFTLGRGNYTEGDVVETARALTGWTFNPDGEFMFRKEHHDHGSKTIFGKTGDFNGDDVIKLILNKSECPAYIVTRIYKFFVNENVDPIRIKELETGFVESGFHIGELMKTIFSSKWFVNNQNVGSKIKSPVELISGISRTFNLRFIDSTFRLNLYSVMGQVLFNPPNVAGWPGGKSWIDSSTLIFRSRLPKVLLNDAAISMEPKKSFDALETTPVVNKSTKTKKTNFICDFDVFIQSAAKLSDDRFSEQLSEILNQKQPSGEVFEMIRTLTGQFEGNEKKIKTAIYLMGLPEYQLS